MRIHSACAHNRPNPVRAFVVCVVTLANLKKQIELASEEQRPALLERLKTVQDKADWWKKSLRRWRG